MCGYVRRTRGENRYGRTKTLARGLAYSLIVVPGILLLLSGISDYVERAISWKWGWAVLFAAMLLGSMLYHTHGARDFHSKWARFYPLFQIGNVIFMGGLVVVVYFLGSIYPHLPQELGGVQPKCAYLDLTKSELSTPTLSALVDAEALQHSTPVVRSKRLQIPYSSSNIVIVRYDGRVYDLYRQAIKAITSCEERTVKEQ